MHHVRLLGGFALEAVSGAQVAPLPQRRAEAALAILAVAGDLGMTRDRLIALLWPESDEARGHHSLRDALHAIRHALGADVIEANGPTLRLTAAIQTDVQAFTAALAASRLSDAVTLYRGSLLDGFHVEHSAEFERWADHERERLARECMDAVEQLAAAAEASERWHDAAQWWARAEEIDPFCTPCVIRRMRALSRAGDRANALRVADVHRRRLARELDVEPDASFYQELARLQAKEPAAPTQARAEAPEAPREEPPTLDGIFEALTDPTRRAMVERLSRGPASVRALARQLDVPLPRIRQYLRVLETSGLVTLRQVGTVRTARIRRRMLRELEGWVARTKGPTAKH